MPPTWSGSPPSTLPARPTRTARALIGERLARGRFEVEYLDAEGSPEHTAAHPRVNVVGTRAGAGGGALLHLNGHIDVVPAGAGWTVDPFGGVILDGRLYGRGSCDMKAGIAAAVYAAEAIRRAGVTLPGTIEVSGTVDEESGGFAGVAWLAEHGRVARGRTDYVIIPEPLNVDRICIGHRGVYWFEVIVHGRIAHGSMPFLGVSAIERMGAVLEALPHRAAARAGRAGRRAMPVVPEGARHATLNVNTIIGGQANETVQSPCVADRCRAVFDRRFLIEEGFEATRAEVVQLLERTAARVPDLRYELNDLMVVHPVQAPEGSPVVASLQRSIQSVLGRDGAARREPRHLRPEALRADRRGGGLRGLRPGDPRARAPAGRMVRRRRHRERDEGAGPDRARPLLLTAGRGDR